MTAKFKYRNRDNLKAKRGIANFQIHRKPVKRNDFIGYPFKILTYGDLAKATVPTMTFEIHVGDDGFMNTSDWARTRKGWRLSLH